MRLNCQELKVIDWIFLVAIVGLCFATFFYHLDEFTIRMWDESRNAVNALEMTRNANPLVTYFNNVPDLWNTKPPLQIWTVAIMFKLFGISELALRLPSALAATIVTLTIFILGNVVLRDRWVGLLGALIILSSMGFPDIHIGRTGDYDAMLVMFVFGGSILYFKFLEEKKDKYIYLSGLCFGLAVMTKGVAGLLIIPGMLGYTVVSGNFIKVIKNRAFWITLSGLGLIIGGYYIGREMINPGYMAAVWREEIWGRTQNNLGSNGGDFWYYWKMMESFRFQKWVYFVPVSILVSVITKNKTIKNLTIYFYLITISYFLIISKTGTKQMWYDAQLYPFMSVLVAILLMEIIFKLPLLLKLVPIVIICFYMQRYIRTNLAYINRPDLEKSDACLKYGYLFRDKTIDKSGFVGVHKATWCNPIYFYLEKENLKRKELSELRAGEKVLTCDSVTYNEIKDKFKIEPIFDNRDGCIGFIVK